MQTVITDKTLSVALSDILASEAPNRVIVVGSDAMLEKTQVIQLLNKLVGKIEVYNKITNNPNLDSLIDGIKLVKQTKPELVLAIGGGSTIDTAKAIMFLAEQKEDILESLFLQLQVLVQKLHILR